MIGALSLQAVFVHFVAKGSIGNSQNLGSLFSIPPGFFKSFEDRRSLIFFRERGLSRSGSQERCR
jgi:hypothetical protein